MDTSNDLSITFLGCGTLGTAILSGVLSSLDLIVSGASPPSGYPSRLPSTFAACVQRPESATRIHKTLSEIPLKDRVNVIHSNNAVGVQSADIVLLGCKPYMCYGILGASDVWGALRGKLLISICAGITISQLREMVPKGCRVIRAMPNTAARIHESMTAISVDHDISEEEKKLVLWIFAQIGKCTIVPEKHMDVCTALCGSGPAFCALMLEAMADGGVLMGLPRAEAQMMAAQTMIGTGRMVVEGQHPTMIREQISTPGGCTIRGLATLEDGKARSVIARTIEEATNIAGGLGGKK